MRRQKSPNLVPETSVSRAAYLKSPTLFLSKNRLEESSDEDEDLTSSLESEQDPQDYGDEEEGLP